MSDSAQARKKARNARNAGPGNFTIIDNEVSMSSIPVGGQADQEYGEDAPQVCHIYYSCSEVPLG